MKIDQFEATGYLSLACPAPLKKAVREGMETWQLFCALPEEEKHRFPYTNDVAVGSGVGYEHKQGTDGQDFKEDFHVRASQRGFLLKEARKVGWVAEEFVLAALNINTHLLPPVLEFARTLERQHGIAGLGRDVKDAMPLWTLRFLHYFPTHDPAAVMAGAHTDKGGITSPLGETAPGVEYLTLGADRKWISVPIGEGEMMIMSGMRMQLRSKNRFKALWHRVAANEETAKKGRYSAVAFIDFLNTPYFDKERVGRTQALAPGSTYDTPLSEFEKMFVHAAPTSAY